MKTRKYTLEGKEVSRAQFERGIAAGKSGTDSYLEPYSSSLPWRVGDEGHTVFGPPNGNPSPETIARGLRKGNASLIANAVNCHAEAMKLIYRMAFVSSTELTTDARKFVAKHADAVARYAERI